MRPLLCHPRLLLGAGLLLALLAVTGCGSTDESLSPVTDDSTPADATDDSVGAPSAPPPSTTSTTTADDGTATTAAGGSTSQASPELCLALIEQPSEDVVALFPEELQQDAADYLEAIEDFEQAYEEGAANGGGGDGGLPDEVPQMSPELVAFVATCQ